MSHWYTPRVIINCKSFEFFVPLLAIATSPRWAKRSRGWISSSKGSGARFVRLRCPGQKKLCNTNLHKLILHLLQYLSCPQFALKILGLSYDWGWSDLG